jgi:uncharacterized protein (DUF488 family)
LKVFTIGFTKKNAEVFFNRLRQPGLARLVDIRLNNVSQLAGFTKKDDLRFFLREIIKIDYAHVVDLAPNQDILEEYKKNGEDWVKYEQQFMALMASRQVENKVSKELVNGGCFLCSEATPDRCHRRLAAEYLKAKWGDLEIEHL